MSSELRRKCAENEADLRRTRNSNFISGALVGHIGLMAGAEIGGSSISRLATDETLHSTNPTLGIAALVIGTAVSTLCFRRGMQYDFSLEAAEDQTQQATELWLSHRS